MQGNCVISARDISAVAHQLSQASVDGEASLSFAGRGLKLDNKTDGKNALLGVV